MWNRFPFCAWIWCGFCSNWMFYLNNSLKRETFLSLIQHVFFIVLIHTCAHLQSWYTIYTSVCMRDCVCACGQTCAGARAWYFQDSWDCGWRGCRVGCWTLSRPDSSYPDRAGPAGPHRNTTLNIHTVCTHASTYFIQHTSLYYKNSILYWKRTLFWVSCATRIRFLRCLRFDLKKNNVSAWRSVRCLRSVDTLQNGAIGWHGGDELLNKVIIFVFFAYKKYSCNFVKLRLNPWCHMDYFNDILATFLDLDRVNYIAVYERVRELSEFVNNFLICVPKMNEGLTGLERHEGE